MNRDYYPPRKSVAAQRAAATKKANQLKKTDRDIQPVVIKGRKIVQTFWGRAWCKNLESYHDFANRLPRGRSYVLNRAVIDLRIAPGHIRAILMGSSPYEVEICIKPLSKKHWKDFKEKTSGQITSAIALLKGELPNEVLKRIVHLDYGLFPAPKEITMQCNCPDSARMCKHIAAAMYGVGHRLDAQPELLFMLRGVDQKELLRHAISEKPTIAGSPQVKANLLEGIFGVKIVKSKPGLDQINLSAIVKKPATKPVKTKSKTKSANAATARKKIRKKRS